MFKGKGEVVTKQGSPALDTCTMTLRRHRTPAPSPLWLLLLCVHIISAQARATPVSQSTTVKQCPALEVTWPEVEVPPNGSLTLSCTGCSRSSFSILYWLGNGSFIEHLPGRLHEGSISRTRGSAGTWLQRALVLEELSPALRSTNFSCVLMDPAQTTLRHAVLVELWAGLKTTLPPTQEVLLSSHHPGLQLPTSAGSRITSESQQQVGNLDRSLGPTHLEGSNP